MLYTEESRIGALAVHIVGNKAKDEPLMVSPSLSDQLSDAALMQTLLAYFMGGFKSEEYFNLYHDTDLTCNEVWNFTCKIFDDPESFYDHSVSLARHLYETGMHPQIKSGEFYVVYFTDCRFGGETVDAVGLFKSETRDTFLDVEAVVAAGFESVRQIRPYLDALHLRQASLGVRLPREQGKRRDDYCDVLSHGQRT